MQIYKKPLFSLLSLIALSIQAQNIENIGKEKPVTLNGFLSTNQVFNITSRDHKLIYSGYYTGSFNFNIYGISVPLTFIYTNSKTQFSNPFNQFGIHPSYKWARAHVGYATMNFSPYTLRGHLFLGAGVELTPGIFRFSAMYGQLNKSKPYDTNSIQIPPAYKRMGYGFKVGVGKGKDFVDVNFFQAQDINQGVPFPDTLNITPQQNTAVSINASKELFKHVVITGEIANSAINKDIRSTGTSESLTGFHPATWFMPLSANTISRKAYKGNISYMMSRFTVGVGYERVDPDYTTFGAYYFTHNLENATVNFSTNFLDNKITFSGNTGLQRDNLNKEKMNTANRVVGSVNTSFVPNEKLNFNISYSNFSSYTNVRSTFDYINQTNPYQTWDTLNYRQISQNINLGTGYQISSDKEKRQNIALNVTYQNSADVSGTASSNVSHFYNVNASYIIALVPQNLNVTTAMNYNRNEVTAANTSTAGPSVTIGKMFFEKKMRTSFSYAYNTSFMEGARSGDIMNFRISNAITILKKHSISLNLLYQLRQKHIDNLASRNTHTTTITFGYVYNFSMFNGKNKNETK